MNEPDAAASKQRIGDLVVLLVLAAFVVVYCLDAIRASTEILNLILVLPLSIAVLALCLVQFVLSFRETGRAAARSDGSTRASLPEPAEHAVEAPPATAQGAMPLREVLPVIVLFAAYILTLPWLGFDVGTCVFLAAFLGLQGERRPAWLLGYSLGLGFALAFFFSRMLPYPMPMLLLGAS